MTFEQKLREDSTYVAKKFRPQSFPIVLKCNVGGKMIGKFEQWALIPNTLTCFSRKALNFHESLCNGCPNPKDRFKLYAGSGWYYLATVPSQFQSKRTVCNNFRGVVPNYHCQVLIIPISVSSFLLKGNALVKPIPLSIEHRLPGLEFEEVIEKKNLVSDHILVWTSNLVLVKFIRFQKLSSAKSCSTFNTFHYIGGNIN